MKNITKKTIRTKIKKASKNKNISKTKNGTNYELFAREIYESILKNEGKDLKVQHNLKIMDSQGITHQIDLYFEYEVAGVTNKLIIECKNYNSPVSIDKLKVFNDILNDLGRNVSGIFLCTKGYQSGPINYAKNKGIHLVMLDKPSEEELKELKIHKNKYAGDDFVMPMTMFETTEIIPEFDMDWFNARYPNQQFKINLTELVVLDKGNKVLFNAKGFYSLPSKSRPEHGLEHVIKFDDGYALVTGAGLVKILSITIRYNITAYYPKFLVRKLNTAAKAILRYIGSDKVLIIDEHGKVDIEE